MDIGTPLIARDKDESLHRVDKIEVISEEDVYIDTVAIVLESSSDVGSKQNNKEQNTIANKGRRYKMGHSNIKTAKIKKNLNYRKTCLF